LVVDASDGSISSGRTSAIVLSRAFNNGASIYSCDTLHGKTIVFDQHTYIGSANISSNSKENLNEIGIISDHPTVMSGSIKIIDELKAQSLMVDADYIERILSITVERTISPNRQRRKIQLEKPRTWLVSIRNDAEYPGNEDVVEDHSREIDVSENEEAAWFWMRKGSKFFDEVKNGDSVVIIEREDTKAKCPEYVYRHFTIINITNDESSETKAYHYASFDKYRIDWLRFIDLAAMAGISRLGSGLNTVRELTEKQSNLLFELWSD
jgi:hypothetical protein